MRRQTCVYRFGEMPQGLVPSRTISQSPLALALLLWTSRLREWRRRLRRRCYLLPPHGPPDTYTVCILSYRDDLFIRSTGQCGRASRRERRGRADKTGDREVPVNREGLVLQAVVAESGTLVEWTLIRKGNKWFYGSGIKSEMPIVKYLEGG